MYRFLNKNGGVYTCFCVGHNSLIVYKKGDVFLNNRLIFEGIENTYADFCSNMFFRFGDTSNSFLGNLQSDFIDKIDFSFSKDTISTVSAIITKNYRYDELDGKVKGDYYYFAFENKAEKLLFKDSEWHFVLTFDDEKKGLCRKQNSFKSLSLETGEYLWETNISIEGDTDPRIKQVLGISGDVLVVFTFGSTLVGIDVHTGKIFWHILPKGFYPSGFTGMAWCWHLEDGYLYLLRHQYYLRINLSNQQLEVLWQAPADTLEFEDCSYTEDHIYFMAIDKKSSIFNTSILGVFDRKALKIVWQHDQPIYSSQPPQSDGDKLYCLDNEGTLHIFERDK